VRWENRPIPHPIIGQTGQKYPAPVAAQIAIIASDADT
jgi:hypothetical protein